ncbi:MAG TPA: hypothetical protein VKE74_10775 [Gemmataceae bacterium]|nr:hypothetical protein [Gemmataceae bacterium]
MKVEFLVLSTTGTPSDALEELVRVKVREYVQGIRLYKYMYYLIRLTAGLSAAVLPFVIASQRSVAIGLSLTIVVTTVVDLVLNPKGKWRLYSQATDRLTLEMLRKKGVYEENKGLVEAILNTETALISELLNLKTLLDSVPTKQDDG